VIVDAGFSGTRVHVYTYDPKTFKKNPVIHQIYEKKINISFTTNQPGQVDNILNPLFQDFPNIPLHTYFYATEGYRSIPLENQILHSRAIRRWFSFHRQFKLQEIRKISGKEEATFAWISNYLHLSHQNSKPIHSGIIEVGAGSAQIAFLYDPIIPTAIMDESNIVRFNWFDNRFITLWTKSLSKFGRENMSKFVICKAPTEFQGCVNQFKNVSIKLNGQGLDEIKTAIANINGQTTWCGLGVLNYLGQSKAMKNREGTYQLSDLRDHSSNSVCEVSHDSIRNSTNPFASTACFNYAYIYTLTHDLFGLDDSTQIHYQSESKGQGWPEGVLIWRLLKG
jgi:hypothetical protein